MLLKLRRELLPDARQYGGVPRCGAENMFVDIWEKILGLLEGGESASVLLGVDYEKAFNRMDHAQCIKQLRLLGATPGSFSLVRAFLEGRRMTISIDGQKAAVPAVDIGRGSPQGSVLGCLLYCVTTQTLTAGLGDPGGGHGIDAFLCVDDTTLFDAIPMSSAIRHISTGTTREELRATELGSAFDKLDRRATDRGMRINAKKTQLLAISPRNGCDTIASMVTGGGEVIESVQRLKLVGFTFGPDPGVGAHVETIEDAYRRKKWMLFNLREAGFKGASLFKLYCCYVRSIIEYCSRFSTRCSTGASRSDWNG